MWHNNSFVFAILKKKDVALAVYKSRNTIVARWHHLTFLYFVGDQKILVIAFFISGWFGQQYDQNFLLILLYKKVN